MSNSDSSDSDWEAVEEKDENFVIQTSCLFCNETFNSPENVFNHCIIQHEFNFLATCKNSTFDVISYIKLVNYIRIHKPAVPDISVLLKDSSLWDCDLYMKPAMSDDPLLTFDIEGYLEEQQELSPQNEHMDDGESTASYQELLQELNKTKTKLENAWDRIDRMKLTLKNLLYPDDHQNSRQSKDNCSDADNSYFSTYDHFGIHHEMLQDKVRTQAYKDAIMGNKEVFANKVVMDLGCGTAILSLFAASAGASKVIAIDQSNVIYQATDIVKENGFDNVIDLLKGRMEDVSFEEKKVDIIVSEWMGYFLLFEGMLDSVLHARDKYLAPGGYIFPDHCALSIAAVSDIEKYDSYVTFWNDVYGYKMSVMKNEVVHEANVEIVKGDSLCSDCIIIKELDLLTCKMDDAVFSSLVELTMERDCKITALVGFFDCMFEKNLNAKVILSTSPLSTPTHWKQTMFLLPKPIDVKMGDKIPCTVSCRRNRRDQRSIVIKIEIGGMCTKYYLA